MKNLIIIIILLTAMGCAIPHEVGSLKEKQCEIWRECAHENFLLRNERPGMPNNYYRNRCLEWKRLNPNESSWYPATELERYKCGMAAGNYFDGLSGVNELKRKGKW